MLLSLAAVVQSVREIVLWDTGQRRYDEDSFLAFPLEFAGYRFDIRDDQPRDTIPSEEEYDGTVQWVRDGEPFGSPSYARVRRGRNDIGRYHLWLDAWIFENRATGRRSLWLVRRLQPRGTGKPTIEVITVEQDGDTRIQHLPVWWLGQSFPLFRSTQFVRAPTPSSSIPLSVLEAIVFSAMPLSMLEGLYFWPLLLVFPIGTFVLGVFLLRPGLW